jgi:DNA-binding NtrC family response regulator
LEQESGMKETKRLLVVDDEAHIRRVLQVAFEKDKYVVETAENVSAALALLNQRAFDCIITDVTMPGQTGYELLDEVRQNWPNVPVIILTAFGTIPQAVSSMRNGAFEYLTKPVDLATLKKVVASAVADGGPQPGKGTRSPESDFSFIAESPAMQELVELVRQVSDSKATVLITGESGVGKEIVAKALHKWSSRSNDAFVAVSCAALPETLLESELFGYEKGAFTGAVGAKPGRFENANGGTLFLDEIGEVPLSVQVKLLRVLQEREVERLGSCKPTKVDVRLITATNRILQQAVDEGTFRLDLMYRLQVVEICIPPLRQRVEDIAPLCAHFASVFCAENGRGSLSLDSSALSMLESYSWPGNVRELENAMERAVVLAPKDASVLVPAYLPPHFRSAA